MKIEKRGKSLRLVIEPKNGKRIVRIITPKTVAALERKVGTFMDHGPTRKQGNLIVRYIEAALTLHQQHAK